MTNVINIYGGSGIGKSTLAAGLFYEMKSRGLNVELVREYVKQWAWDGIKVGPFDAPYLFGKQSKAESRLYNKVDWVVTDSPLLLCPIYETYYNKESIVLPSVLSFLNKAKEHGIIYNSFCFSRNKKFDPKGRYETEEQAKEVDCLISKSLSIWGINYTEINVTDEERVIEILKHLGL